MKTKNKNHLLLLAAILSVGTPLPLQAAGGVALNNEIVSGTNIHEVLDVPDPLAVFTYELEGRPDPFNPFITEKAASNINMDEIVENEDTLSGMQLFEPGQLKLVAIAFEKNGELAMVEDAAGQGYTIRPGIKIGKKGIVAKIIQNQVIIEETSLTRAGKKLTTNIVMQLKKEGEE